MIDIGVKPATTEVRTDFSAVVVCKTFVHIDIDDIRLHTGDGVISWNGQRWIGLGRGLDAKLNTTISASLPNVQVPKWAIKLTFPDDVAGGMKTWNRKRYRGKQVTAYICGFDASANLLGQLQKLDGYIVHVSDGGSNMTIIEAAHFQPPSDRSEVYFSLLDEMIRSTIDMPCIDLAIVEKRNRHSEKVVIGWRHQDNKIVELSEPSDDLAFVRHAFYSLAGRMRDQSTTAPRFLFKYENRRFCDSFLSGRVKVTSARGMERYEDVRRRDVETRKETHLPVSEIVELESLPGIRGQSSARERDGYRLRFDIEPYFAFCTSTVLDAALLDEFEGSDTILHIHDPGDFVHRLLLAGREMLEAEDDVCWHGCVSYERHRDFVYYGRVRASIAHPATLKPKGYEPQQEHRVVWVTSSEVEQNAADPTIVDMGNNERAVTLRSRRDVLALLKSIAEWLDGVCGDVKEVIAISSFVCKR